MENRELVAFITQKVMEAMNNNDVQPKNKIINVGISARHVHLTREHVDVLFGKGYKLTWFKDLSQPGQFAANEKVTLVGKNGKTIEGVRILSPERKETQIELAKSDARVLGTNPPIRSSGELEHTPGITLVGPKGSVTLDKGCIIADRHIHFTPKDAEYFGVKNNEKLSVKIKGEKGGIMYNVTAKVREDFFLEMHVDTDDANAFMINNGDEIEILK